MENMPSPQHGNYQKTLEGNLLICLKKNNPGKFFFYMTIEGNYIVCKYTERTGMLPNKTEWNFLLSRTQKVEKLNEETLRIAEDLISYIVQDTKYPWKISEVREAMEKLAQSQPSPGSFSNVPGFGDLFKKFVY